MSNHTEPQTQVFRENQLKDLQSLKAAQANDDLFAQRTINLVLWTYRDITERLQLEC